MEPAADDRFAGGSRRTIDQATGLLMGRFALDARTATALLTWLARRTDVATSVIAGRFLDAAAHGAGPSAGPHERLDGVLADLTAGAPTTGTGGTGIHSR